MKRLLFVLCIITVLICPVMGYSESYTCPTDAAINVITIQSDAGVSGDIDLVQADGSHISGSWSITETPWVAFPYTATATMGADTDSFTSYLPGPFMISIDYSINNTESRSARLRMGQAVVNNLMVETSMSKSPIIGYTITSDAPVSIQHTEGTIGTITKLIAGEASTDVIEQIKKMWAIYSSIFFSLLYWLKFLFVDNLIMIVVLYMTGTMAYAAMTCRNIFQFYKVWFRQQVAFFHFVANIFSTVISIVAQIAQSLKII